MFAALIAGYFHYGRHLGQRSDPLRDSVLLRFSSDHPTLAQENEGEDDDEAEPIEMEGT